MATLSIARKTHPQELPAWKIVGSCERAAGILLFAATLPVQLAVGAAIAALSGRTPLIAHRRVGRSGAALWVLKLRTMWDSARPISGGWIEYIDETAGSVEKSPADARVKSGFARFCRRHSLDELPQLWQVARGEMALIGPRPLTRREIREHYAGDADELLSVKPGIAGLWQTSGRNRLTYAERRELDLRFVRERSASMYLRILARVLPEICFGKNAW